MLAEDRNRTWTEPVIGGGAAAGKTTAARAVAARYGVSVLPVDAIWFALKAATDPTSYPELHYFDPHDAEMLRLKAEYWCERHIRSAEAISQAMDPVIEYYLWERWPVIVEVPGSPLRPQHGGLVNTMPCEPCLSTSQMWTKSWPRWSRGQAP
jgi:2-phosphoglycerate kinase